jgi:hypothetical protein
MSERSHSIASRRALPGLLAAGLLIAWEWRLARDTRAGLRPRARRSRRGRWQIVSLTEDTNFCDPTGASGIAGLVLIGPLGPVATAGDPCPDQPFATTMVVRNAQGHDVCFAHSGQDGRFQAGLLPGWYQLVPMIGPSGLPYAAPQDITVELDQYTDVVVRYESGRR